MSIRASMRLYHPRYVTPAPTIYLCPRRVWRLRDSTSSTFVFHRQYHILRLGTRTSLYTTSGAVTANIWVTGNNRLKRVSMKLCSDNGRVCAKVVRLVHLCYKPFKIFSNKQTAHSMISSIMARASPALPSTLSFGPTTETCPSRCPAGSRGR